MIAKVNNSRAVSVRLVTQWRGVWLADVDLDPEDAQNAPSGRVALTIGAQVMSGTVDPLASGRFVSSVRLRIVGGANGWSKTIQRQDYHNDAGLNSTQIYTAVAASVGEVISDHRPESFGSDYVQTAGPASRIFGDHEWHVDLAGITQIAERTAIAVDGSVEILSFDPNRQTLLISADAVILPGTTFTDSRFDGTLIARDVEQIFDSSGSRAIVWCSNTPIPRAMSALTNLVREITNHEYSRSYLYRVVTQGTDGRVQLQAVDPTLGAPDLLPVYIWPGMQGDSATVQLSSEVEVHFAEADRTKPRVMGFSPLGKPTKRTVDASAEVDVGPSAPIVNIAGGSGFIATSASVSDIAAGLLVLAEALVTAGATPPLTPLLAMGNALAVAVTPAGVPCTPPATGTGTLHPIATTKVKAT